MKNLDVTPFYGAALGFHLRGDSRRMMMPLMIRYILPFVILSHKKSIVISEVSFKMYSAIYGANSQSFVETLME